MTNEIEKALEAFCRDLESGKTTLKIIGDFGPYEAGGKKLSETIRAALEAYRDMPKLTRFTILRNSLKGISKRANRPLDIDNMSDIQILEYFDPKVVIGVDLALSNTGETL